MTAAAQPAVRCESGFVVVHLRGDHFDIGVQHGLALREQIQRMRATLYQDLIFAHGRVTGWAFLLLAHSIISAMARHIPRPLLEEMRGVAIGSDIPFRDVLFFNCFDDLLHSLVRLALMVPPAARARVGLACSCFVALGARTSNGQMLLARNLDYYVEGGVLGADQIVTRTMKELLVCYVVKPTIGQAYVSVGWPAYVGVVTGLNRSGLALSCLTSATPGATPNGLPLTLLYRMLIQRHTRLEQVERAIVKSQRTLGNNLAVVSVEDRGAALIEFSPSDVRRHAPRDDLLFATNHFQDPRLADRQTQWLIPSSVHRLERLRHLCHSDRVSPDSAMRYLLDSAPRDPQLPDPFSSIQNLGTIYSAVVEPEQQVLWLRANDRPDRSFVRIDAGREFEADDA